MTILLSTQRMEGAKKRIFGVFEAFFDLYAPQTRRKHDTSLNFAAFFGQRKIMTQKVPQRQRKRQRKRWRKKVAKKRRKI